MSSNILVALTDKGKPYRGRGNCIIDFCGKPFRTPVQQEGQWINPHPCPLRALVINAKTHRHAIKVMSGPALIQGPQVPWTL